LGEYLLEDRAFTWLGGPIQLQHPLTRAVTDPVWDTVVDRTQFWVVYARRRRWLRYFVSLTDF